MPPCLMAGHQGLKDRGGDGGEGKAKRGEDGWVGRERPVYSSLDTAKMVV